MSEKVITKSPKLFSPGHIDPVVHWVRKLGIRADLLSGLEGEFGSLVKTEGEILKGCSPLGANCDYEKQRGKSKWSELRPDDQPGFVFCDGPEDMYQCPRKDFWRKFEAVANKAGRALGSRPDIAPCDFFVYCLFIYLLKIKSHRLRFADHKGGIINEICEAARDFIAEIAQMEEAGEFESKQNGEKKDEVEEQKPVEVVLRPAPESRRRGNPARKDSVEYRNAVAVKEMIPRVVRARAVLKEAKRLHPDNQAQWKTAIRQEGFSDSDIDLIIESKTEKSGSVKIVARRCCRQYQTISNSYSKFKDGLGDSPN